MWNEQHTEDYCAFYVTIEERNTIINSLTEANIEINVDEKRDGYGDYTLIRCRVTGTFGHGRTILLRPVENRGQIYTFYKFGENGELGTTYQYKFGEIVRCGGENNWEVE